MKFCKVSVNIHIDFRTQLSRMVRTKGDGGAARTVASKAPRKNLGGGGSSAATRAISAASSSCPSPGGKYSGGNSYNPQPTPDWQKPLTSFFQRDPNAPPPKMKKHDEDEEDGSPEPKNKGKGKGKSSKKGQEEDEENEPPKKMISDEVIEREAEVLKDKGSLKKNGVISDSDVD